QPRVQLLHGAQRVRQLGLGLLQRIAGVGGVQSDQDVAGVDVVGIVDGNRRYRAADACRQLDAIAVHIGVAGGGPVACHAEVIDRPHCTDDDEDQQQQQQ